METALAKEAAVSLATEKLEVWREPRLGGCRTPVVVCAIRELGEAADVIRAGAGFAARLDAAQVLAYIQPAPLIAAEPQVAFASPQPDAGSQLREGVRELARVAAGAGAGENTRIHAAFGDLVTYLVRIADSEAAAFILVGSRRFSMSMLDRAPCPVLVIPDAPVRDALPGAARLGRAADGG